MVLENDGTEFDDDEILLEYAKESSETLVLVIVAKNSEWKSTVDKENNTNLMNTQIASSSSTRKFFEITIILYI